MGRDWEAAMVRCARGPDIFGLGPTAEVCDDDDGCCCGAKDFAA